MRKALWIGSALCLLAFSPRAATPSDNPRQLGPVVVKAMKTDGGTLTIWVSSGGCTDKTSLKPHVAREKDAAPGAVRCTVTFERVRPDSCKMVLHDEPLEYDLAKDLGISAGERFAVAGLVGGEEAQKGASDPLAKTLLAATVHALELEIRGYESRLEKAEAGFGPPENVEKFKGKIAELRGWLEQYRAMKPSEYKVGAPEPGAPEALEKALTHGPVQPAVKQVVKVWVKEPQREGSTLFVDGMSKSGPFYHVVGLAGGNYNQFHLGERYEITLYLVYKREYYGLVADYYVYIADVK